MRWAHARKSKGKTKMKKLTIMFAVVLTAIVTNAAAFKWQAGNIYGPDGKTKWSGTVSLYATGVEGVIYETTAANGVVNVAKLETDKVAGGNYYDFYFTIVDNGKTFTSPTVNAAAQATATANLTFGNMATATQNASNWQVVPEPTSGLLLLLGVAGLALKRKRA